MKNDVRTPTAAATAEITLQRTASRALAVPERLQLRLQGRELRLLRRPQVLKLPGVPDMI